MNPYLKKYNGGGKTKEKNPPVDPPTYSYSWASSSNPPPTTTVRDSYGSGHSQTQPSIVPTVPISAAEIENRKKAELVAIARNAEEKQKIKERELVPGIQQKNVPIDNTYTGVNPFMTTTGNVTERTLDEELKRKQLFESYSKNTLQALNDVVGNVGAGLLYSTGEAFTAPFSAATEGFNYISGKPYNFQDAAPNATRIALNASGQREDLNNYRYSDGSQMGQQKTMTELFGIDRKENPTGALIADVFTPTLPFSTIGKAFTGANKIQYAPKMNALDRAIDNPMSFIKNELNPIVTNIDQNAGFKFADETIEAQKALREAEELALKQKQPIKYELPTSNDPNVGPFSKYIEEYDKSGLAQWDAKQLNKDAYEELKNAYRKEFESNWGKKYDEKDLLTYAKIKEGISTSNNPFYDEDFLNLNNQFVKDFDVKDITDLNQKIALSAYTSGRFRGFNQSLTSGHNLPFYKEFMNPFLDDALKQNALEKDLSLIRGFGNQKLKVIRNDEILNDQSIKSVIPGDLFSSPSYQSTGLIESPHFFDTKKIIAPKGTNFGYANKQGLSYVPAEMEVTLPRNTMYEVLDDKTIKVIKDQGQGILPESSISTISKATDNVAALISPHKQKYAKEIEQITTYKNDLLNRLKTTEEGKRRLENLGLTPEDLNDIDLEFHGGGSMAMPGMLDYTGNPYVNIDFGQLEESISLGLTPMNVASHEIGHALQYLAALKKYKSGLPFETSNPFNYKNLKKTPADQEMLDWLTKNVDKSDEPYPGYFDEFPGIDKSLLKENPTKLGSNYFTARAEPYAHLREFRTSMIEEGILVNEWDNVTEDMVDKFMKSSSGNRTKGYMENTPDFRKRMSMLLNKYPAVVPGILGTGAATYGVNKMTQQPKQEYRTGGAVNPYLSYNNGGKIVTVGGKKMSTDSEEYRNLYNNREIASYSTDPNIAFEYVMPEMEIKDSDVYGRTYDKGLSVSENKKRDDAKKKIKGFMQGDINQPGGLQRGAEVMTFPIKGAGAAVNLLSETANTPLALLGEVISGRNNFPAAFPSLSRSMENAGLTGFGGDPNAVQQMTPGNAIFPNNQYAAMAVDLPADILLGGGVNALYKQGLKQAPKILSSSSKNLPSFNFNTGNYQNILDKGLDVHDVRLKYHNNEILDLDEIDMLNKYGKGTKENYKNADPTNLSDAFLDIYGKLSKEPKTKKGDFIKMFLGEDFDKINIPENIQNNIDAPKDIINFEQNIAKPKSPTWNIEDFKMGIYRGPYERTAESRLADKWLTEWYDNPTSKQRFLDYGGTEEGWTEVLNSLENPIRSGKPYPKSLEDIAGLYSPKLNKASINTNITQEELIPTGVHEGAHKTRIIDKNHILQKGPSGLKDLYNDITDASKLQPEETYSEIIRMRYMQGWKPETVVTMDMLEKGLKELGGGYMMSAKIKDKNKFLEIVNKAPIVIPVVTATGAAAAGASQLNQEAPQNKYGGAVNPYLKKYNNGGKVIIDGKEVNTSSQEYKDLYEAGVLMGVDNEGLPNMYAPEVEVTAEAPLWLKQKRQQEQSEYTGDELERYMYQGKKPDREKDFLLPPGERLKIYNAVLPFEYPNQEFPKALKRYITGEKRTFLGQSSIKEEGRDLGKTDEDAWAHFMGLPQLYNTVTKSEYVPTNSKEKGKDYYTIRKGYPDFDELLLENAHNWFQRKENANATTLKGVGSPFMPLENVTYSKGQDEKGKYYSMYDIYDFNVPYQKGIGKPYDIYDRVYYDDSNPDKPTLLNKKLLVNPYIKNYKYGGPVDPVDPDDKEAAMRGMMKARMAIDAELGRNPAAKRMTSISPKEYTFTGNEMFYDEKQNIPAGATGTHYTTGEGNVMFPIIQEGQDGNLFFNRYASPTDKEAMRFETPEEASYFGENYKNVAPMMYNERPTQEDRKKLYQDINNVMSGKKENTGITMTKLNPDEEFTYQQWAKGLTPNLQGSMDDKNYDMRGAWKSEEQPELFYNDEQGNFQSAHPIDVNQQGSIYEPHLFSRNPFTGKMLKGPNHETFMHALEGDIKAGLKVKMDLKTGDMYTYEKGGDTGHSTVEIERSERVYTPDGKLIMETPADAPTHEEGGVKVTLPAGSLVFPKKYYKALDAASGLPAFKKIADTMLNNAEKAYLRGEAYSSGGKRQ